MSSPEGKRRIQHPSARLTRQESLGHPHADFVFKVENHDNHSSLLVPLDTLRTSSLQCSQTGRTSFTGHLPPQWTIPRHLSQPSSDPIVLSSYRCFTRTSSNSDLLLMRQTYLTGQNSVDISRLNSRNSRTACSNLLIEGVCLVIWTSDALK